MTGSVSVIIPTYNRRDTVGRAIESALGQTRRPREIIVVDDGSTDGSEEMLAPVYGAAVRVIGQANSGAAAARNTGVLAASGDLVAFLDSDDVWDSDKLAAQTDALRGSAAVLNYTNYRHAGRADGDEFADVGLVLPADCVLFERPLELLTRWGRAGEHLSGTLVRRQALLDAGLFDTRLRVAEDTKLFFDLARRGAFSLLRRPFWTRSRTVDPVTLTVPSDEAYQRDHTNAVLPLLEDLYAAFPRDPAIRRNTRSLLAHFTLKQAKFHAADGRMADARAQAARAFAYAPFSRAGLRSVLIAAAPTTAVRLVRKAG